MKMLALCFSFVSFFLTNALASTEQNRYYVQINVASAINSAKVSSSNEGDLLLYKSKYQRGAAASFSIGYKYLPQIRFSWDFSYMPKWRIMGSSTTYEKLDDNTYEEHRINYYSNISSFSTAISGYYDFFDISKNNFSPFVMAGVGLSHNEISDVKKFVHNELSSRSFKNSSLNFLWKVGLGVNLKLDNHISLNLGYQFNDLGKVKNYAAEEFHTLGTGDVVLVESSEIFKFKKIHSHQILVGLIYNF